MVTVCNREIPGAITGFLIKIQNCPQSSRQQLLWMEDFFTRKGSQNAAEQQMPRRAQIVTILGWTYRKEPLYQESVGISRCSSGWLLAPDAEGTHSIAGQGHFACHKGHGKKKKEEEEYVIKKESKCPTLFGPGKHTSVQNLGKHPGELSRAQVLMKEAKMMRKHCLSRWLNGKESTCQCRRHRRHEFDPWVGKIPWRRKWQPTPVFLLGEFHGQRSLAGLHSMGLQRVRHPQ